MDIGIKSREKLREFVKKQLLAIQQEMIKEIPEGSDVQLPDVPEALVEQAMEMYLGTSNRSLFDWFDENKIFITIDNGDDFYYSINNGEPCDENYKTRPECEKAAFQDALNRLEIKLNSK